MPCNDLRGHLSLFGSGDLEASDSVKVREHLKDCPSCREHAEGFDKTRSILGSYAEEQSRAPHAEDVWERVAGRMGKPPKGDRASP